MDPIHITLDFVGLVDDSWVVAGKADGGDAYISTSTDGMIWAEMVSVPGKYERHEMDCFVPNNWYSGRKSVIDLARLFAHRKLGLRKFNLL